jgi:hypothetical protein
MPVAAGAMPFYSGCKPSVLSYSSGMLFLFISKFSLTRASHEARPENLIWALSSVALMQVGFWISNRIRPLPPQFSNALLGHLVLFVARMSFVFPASVFGFLFIAQSSAFHIPAFRYVVALLGLFSLYCYTRELERLGDAFLGREKLAK